MRFWLIYEVLFVGFLGPDRRICFIVGFCFTTSPKMKAPAEVADRIELKIRERREMVRKDIILGYILLQRYIILMSRIGK